VLADNKQARRVDSTNLHFCQTVLEQNIHKSKQKQKVQTYLDEFLGFNDIAYVDITFMDS
jgi:hypothetical protein